MRGRYGRRRSVFVHRRVSLTRTRFCFHVFCRRIFTDTGFRLKKTARRAGLPQTAVVHSFYLPVVPVASVREVLSRSAYATRDTRPRSGCGSRRRGRISKGRLGIIIDVLSLQSSKRFGDAVIHSGWESGTRIDREFRSDSDIELALTPRVGVESHRRRTDQLTWGGRLWAPGGRPS